MRFFTVKGKCDCDCGWCGTFSEPIRDCRLLLIWRWSRLSTNWKVGSLIPGPTVWMSKGLVDAPGGSSISVWWWTVIAPNEQVVLRVVASATRIWMCGGCWLWVVSRAVEALYKSSPLMHPFPISADDSSVGFPTFHDLLMEALARDFLSCKVVHWLLSCSVETTPTNQG